MSKGCAVVGAGLFFVLVIGLCIVLPIVNVFTHLPPAGAASETTHPIPGLTANQTDSLWSLVLGAGVILTVAAIVRSVARSRGPKTITGNPGPEFVRPMDGVVEPWAANVPMGEIMQRDGVKRPAYRRLDLFSTSPEQDAIDRATPITEMSVHLRSEK